MPALRVLLQIPQVYVKSGDTIFKQRDVCGPTAVSDWGYNDSIYVVEKGTLQILLL